MGALFFAICGPSAAQPVGLTPDSFRKVIEPGAISVVIERDQDQGATIPPDFARTPRACPPFCIPPMIAAVGVRTVAEPEPIGFLEDRVASGQGLLIDARLPEWVQKGTRPGAVNMPFTALGATNPYRDAIFEALGGVMTGGV